MQEPLDYAHLLEEGERINGHDRSLEETWIWSYTRTPKLSTKP
jgi:hypothetical protein